MNDQLTTADRIAMVVGGGLIVLGTVVMGLFETIIGNPHVMEQTDEAGDVIAHPRSIRTCARTSSPRACWSGACTSSTGSRPRG